MACKECGNNTRNTTINKIKSKVTNIATGCANFVNKKEEVEEFAKPRLAICAACPDLIVLVQTKSRLAGICEHCGCPPSTKCRVEQEHCPINKW